MEIKNAENYQCKICGCSKGKIKVASPELTYFCCLNCGVVSQYPLPTEKDTVLLYDRESYFNEEQHRYIQDEEIYRKTIYKYLLKETEKIKKTGKLLEVGCGTGIFLEEAKKNGWDGTGVELSSWAVRFCQERKNLKVHLGNLRTAPFDKKSFDVILYNHILEHLIDPIGELSLAKEFLDNSGILVVGVPNFNGSQARRLKEKWSHINKEHIYQFTPTTLKRTLEFSGYKVISIIGNSYFGKKGFDLFLSLLKDKLLLGNCIIAFAKIC